MTSYSDASSPFADLHPLLRPVNQAIYSVWNLPLPAPAIPIPTDVIPDGDRQVTPNLPPLDNQKPGLSQPEPTLPAMPVPSQPAIPLHQPPQRIGRLGKIHWSKPKAANCAGRRKLKRGKSD